MPYRPGHTGFEVNAGSALTGVLPAAGLAAAIGTACFLVFLVAASALGDISFSIRNVAGSLVGMVVFMMLGTLIGTIICAFYIALVGVPIAMIMGERVTHPLAIAVSMLAAIGASYLATNLFIGGFDYWDARDRTGTLALALAYAIPAGLLYRHAVINAREFSPWSD